jgi:methylthioribose-1-phosphate isomerase
MLLRPIVWTPEGTIRFLDQRLLPGREVWVECRDFHSLLSAIRDMAVRGAPALGIASAMGLALGARDLPEDDRERFEAGFFCLVEALKQTRPTARNLFWAVERMSALVREERHLSLPRLKERLQEEAQALAEEDLKANQALGEWGQSLLPQRARVLTHCNAGALATGGHGTALGVIRSAWKAGKEILVYVTETRPLLQGSRLTAWELAREGIPLLLITDSMAGYFMARGEIDLVLVGADRIAANGDTANKIGTYTLAVLAYTHGIPFYVAAPLSTFDPERKDGSEIPIEHRDEEEVKSLGGQQLAPEGVKAANPAFDVTPSAYISAFITERGILHSPFPEAIAEALGGPSRDVERPQSQRKGAASGEWTEGPPGGVPPAYLGETGPPDSRPGRIPGKGEDPGGGSPMSHRPGGATGSASA